MLGRDRTWQKGVELRLTPKKQEEQSPPTLPLLLMVAENLQILTVFAPLRNHRFQVGFSVDLHKHKWVSQLPSWTALAISGLAVNKSSLIFIDRVLTCIAHTCSHRQSGTVHDSSGSKYEVYWIYFYTNKGWPETVAAAIKQQDLSAKREPKASPHQFPPQKQTAELAGLLPWRQDMDHADSSRTRWGQSDSHRLDQNIGAECKMQQNFHSFNIFNKKPSTQLIRLQLPFFNKRRTSKWASIQNIQTN